MQVCAGLLKWGRVISRVDDDDDIQRIAEPSSDWCVCIVAGLQLEI